MIIYDIEIKNAIPDRDGGKPYEGLGIKYCGGWEDHANMGISVIVAYDFSDDRYKVYCDDNKDDFAKLIERADIIAGFNNHKFDDNVLRTNWGITVPAEKSCDLLVEIWRALSLPLKFNYKVNGGFGLDAMASATLRHSKTGTGAYAPVDWQKGNIGAVIDYCINDVWLTKRLFTNIIAEGVLVNPKTMKYFKVGHPKNHLPREDEKLPL